ncbi:MAG TPA: VWA domain-containing protein [Spirochaetia bacterium]|nr:VWA domain-containing protein [Spirochaetales bacterium]HRY78930.1 VWA domain-containing protein [Spirochaetia bacterium]HRZ88416.1 VWA domain-containing protein [Spirochaetia bacterium]
MAQSKSGRWILSGIVSLALGAAALTTLASCSAAPAQRPETVAAAPEPETKPSDDYSPKPPVPPPAPGPSGDKGSAAAAASESLKMEEFSKDRAAGAPASPSAPGRPSAPPSASGLKAGFSDDNAQFNYFLGFLEEFGHVPNHALEIGERITLRIQDSAGKAVPNARVAVRAGTRVLDQGLSYADGTFRLYPLIYETTAASLSVRVESQSGSASLDVTRDGPRRVVVKLDRPRVLPAPLPLDVLFVLDTTGSMGEEIERLRDTIEIVHANIRAMTPKPAVRFGMVLYKDRGDEYVTQVVPFTADLPAFQAALAEVYASGGGDTPEDLQAALEDSLKKMDWNKDGVRTAFVITDAEPHLDYGQSYTYAHAAKDARARGIRFHTIGTGGLAVEGEYVLRQLAQFTEGKYIFLTYGETGESEGGAPGSVSHHTGSNFQTDKLEAIVIRFVKEDLANLSDVPLSMDEDYFEATKIPEEERDATLDKLFEEALRNLTDYSTFKVEKDTPAAVLPLVPNTPDLASNAEYFGERLLLTAVKSKAFKLVERKSLQSVLEELELQLSGLADEKAAARAGELLGADILVTGSVFRRDGKFEIFLRLVRVSTAEVLSVARARVDAKLGL